MTDWYRILFFLLASSAQVPVLERKILHRARISHSYQEGSECLVIKSGKER